MVSYNVYTTVSHDEFTHPYMGADATGFDYQMPVRVRCQTNGNFSSTGVSKPVLNNGLRGEGE